MDRKTFTLETQKKILRYLRISQGVTQQELANITGTSRFKISRAELCKAELSTREWWELMKRFNLDLDCIYRGQLSIENNNDADKFKLPLRFAKHAYSGGRVIQFHLKNFKAQFGEEGFESFCEQEGVNPLYFLNLNNSININFNLKLIQSMILKGNLKNEEDISNYVQRGFNSYGHRFQVEGLFLGSGIENILRVLNNVELFENDHHFSLEDCTKSGKSVTVSFCPKEHVNLKLYRDDPVIKNVIGKMIKGYFKTVAKTPLLATEQASFDKGDRKSIYTFSEIRP